jgi:ADP-heptose:LPS heptosyltransferase
LDLQRILVFRIGHLGDTLVALPALWALRKSFPSAHISYLSNIDLKNPHYLSAASVLPAEGLFDGWVSYPNLSGGFRDALSLLKLAARLRRMKFDAVVYLMTRNRTSTQIDRDVKFFRLAGVKKILGAEFLKANSLGLEIPKPVPRIERESDFLIRMLRHDELIDANASFETDLGLTTNETHFADQWLEANAPSAGSRRIAIAPGSKWDSKIWDEERFAAVVNRLIETHDVFPIVFGGAEDRGKGDRLIGQWSRGANAAGHMNVRQSAAALGRCDLYLGNDTGTMHLAAAAGTPCVAIFAAIDWEGRWEPFGDGHVAFRRRVECEGCHSPMCFNHHKCLDLIGTDEVYEACALVLDRSGRTDALSGTTSERHQTI